MNESALATAGRRRHLQNRPVNNRQLIEVAAVAVIAGVVAVVISDAAPTATGWIDALERFAAAALVALAASRARRWTLITASVVVTAASPWPQLLVGVAVLLMAIVMVEQRRRSRLVGAGIGAVAAVLSMRLDAPGPLGVETVLALVAALPILVSGYRRASLRARRYARRAIVGGACFVVLATALAGLGSLLGYSAINDGASSTEAAVDLASDGTGDASAAAFGEANEHFEDAKLRVGPLGYPARVIPVIGANVAAVQRAVGAGVDLTDAGTSLVAGAEFETVQLDDGGVDLVALEEFAPRVKSASEAVDQAAASLANAESSWLVPQLRDRVDEVQDRLASVDSTSDNALLALEGLPALLGGDGPRRYVFLLGNPAESRDLGGHIGNWAELVADEGRLELIEVGGPLDLSDPDLSAQFSETFPLYYTSLDPARSPQNLGATPDLGIAGDATARLFEAKRGEVIDGVAYADPYAFAALADLVGGVTVATPQGPLVLSGPEAVEFLTLGQYERFADEDSAGDAIEVAVEELFDKLTTTRLAGPQTLGEVFAPLVAQGRLQFWSDHSDDSEMLDHFGLSGLIAEPAGGDVLGVFNRNSGPNKLDSFLERQVDAQVLWDPTTGAVGSTVTVDLHNAAPKDMTNTLLGGNTTSAGIGTNVTSLVVMSPHRLRSLTVDGFDTAPQPLKDGDLWRYEVRVPVPPQETVSVQYQLEGRVEPGAEYPLSWVGQPLVNDGPLEIQVEPLRGKIVECSVTSRDTDAGCSENFRTFGASQAVNTALLWSAEER